MKWYLKVLRKYTDVSGRARRTEYWMFVLFNLLFAMLAALIDNLLGSGISEFNYGIVYLIYALFTFIPSLAVLIRRLHDVGKSGWMILISLIPIIGAIWIFVLLVTDSESGANEYGPNPKEQLI